MAIIHTGKLEDDFYMDLALAQANLAFERDEVPVGAIVVWENKIISKGHNQVEMLNDCTAHAEILAITSACNQLSSKYLSGATIYITVEPCLMCCGAIHWAKMGRVVFGAADVKNGYRKYTTDVWPFHPRATLTEGIKHDECASLMKSFFQRKR